MARRGSDVIELNANGQLADGWHRALAVVMSGVTIRVVIRPATSRIMIICWKVLGPTKLSVDRWRLTLVDATSPLKKTRRGGGRHVCHCTLLIVVARWVCWLLERAGDVIY